MKAENSYTLLQSIRGMPGQKQLTLVIADTTMIRTIFSPRETETTSMRKVNKVVKGINEALSSWGGLIVRQVLPLRVLRRDQDGTLTWINRINIYGVAFGNGEITILSQDEVEDACRLDLESGDLGRRDPDVTYRKLICC